MKFLEMKYGFRINIITILNVGLRLAYEKNDVHPYFAKNLKDKPEIKSIIISFYKWKYEKTFYPTYKITVTWKDIRTPLYELENLANMTKGSSYVLNRDRMSMVIFFKGAHSEIKTLASAIRNMKMHPIPSHTDCYCEEEEETEPELLGFETEVVLA